MYGVRYFFQLTFSTIIFQNLSAQVNNEDVYIIFESSSNKSYEYEVGNGEVGKEKIYRKELKKNGDMLFYIKKELFRYIGHTDPIDTCKIANWPKNNISKISDLKIKVDSINPLYPYKVFPNLFLFEKLNDSIFVGYRVNWEYYLE